MTPPAAVMTIVSMFANDDIVPIVVPDNNLCGHRDGGRKHRTSGRT
jgi:hypothetical protein